MAITGEGIDVSWYQDIEDASALRDTVPGGYAWVKIYDGNPDRPIDLDQVPTLRDGGFAVGGYGFVRRANVRRQTDGFLGVLAQTDAHDIVPMVDLEPANEAQGGFANSHAGAALASATGREITLGLIEEGYRPIVYSSQNFMTLMKVEEWGFPVLRCVANYSRQPTIPHDVWQRGDKFLAPGVRDRNGNPGRIDRNTAFVDLSARKD